ncbi:MAG: protocatechuate 3,4-dioxygenase [Candidatus Thiodiazotropha sp. LLP2]
MPETIDNRRRTLICGAACLLTLPAHAQDLLTPSQTPGPFYPDLPILDQDNDLTRIAGRDGIAEGIISELSGHLVNINGSPLAGVRIEIWQCDHNGRYRHSRDDNSEPMDKNFQGLGHSVTDQMGRYRFRTILPVPYPGRTPHIHAAIFRSGMKPFVTQIYIEGEPRNSNDFLFQRIPSELRPLVLAKFKPSNNEPVELAAQFNFILMDRAS